MQCSNATTALDVFMKNFRRDSEPTYVSLFCCGCSTPDVVIAEISHYWNIPQVVRGAF